MRKTRKSGAVVRIGGQETSSSKEGVVTHDVFAWFRQQRRRVARLPRGLAVRLTVRFTQEELRILADGGVEITPAVLRRWIDAEAVAIHLNGLRLEDDFWNSTEACANQERLKSQS